MKVVISILRIGNKLAKSQTPNTYDLSNCPFSGNGRFICCFLFLVKDGDGDEVIDKRPSKQRPSERLLTSLRVLMTWQVLCRGNCSTKNCVPVVGDHGAVSQKWVDDLIQAYVDQIATEADSYPPRNEEERPDMSSDITRQVEQDGTKTWEALSL